MKRGCRRRLAFNYRTMARKSSKFFAAEMRRLEANNLLEYKQFSIATDEAKIPDWDANGEADNPSGHMEAEERKNA